MGDYRYALKLIETPADKKPLAKPRNMREEYIRYFLKK